MSSTLKTESWLILYLLQESYYKTYKNMRVQIIIKNSHKQNIAWQTTATITDGGFKQKVTAQDPQKDHYIIGIW